MRALITGIHGQDGYYLSKLLLDKGYEVFGLDPYRPEPRVLEGVELVEGDLLDPGSLTRAMRLNPDEVYNLGALSFVGGSWGQPAHTTQTNGVGVVNLLEAIRETDQGIRFYQASTSEMFGNAGSPQDEDTPFHPRSPYGVAKLCAHWMTVNYRESYGMPTSCGILFNHESPMRGARFVTKKICAAAARKEPVSLGNLDARRDWGFAGDYVEAMWRMMQRKPDDFVIATGETHSVREFADLAYARMGLDWQEFVSVDERFMRPNELHELRGDASKARKRLDWSPSVSFTELVNMMVDHEVRYFV